jgi:hypothetical protein
LQSWHAAGAEALFIGAGEDAGTGTGNGGQAAYRDRLSPREQLRALWGRVHGAEALLDHYRDHPDDFGRDRGEQAHAFIARLHRDCGHTQACPTDGWPDNWSAAIDRLRGPEHYREFDDLAFLPFPDTLPRALLVEATWCIARSRHRWWRDGAGLPDRALVLLPYKDPADWGHDDTLRKPARLQAILGSACILLSAERAPALVPPPSPGVKVSGLDPPDPDLQRYFDYQWSAQTAGGEGDGADADQSLQAMARLWSEAIARLWLRGRPLRHYGCTLLFPFDPGTDQRDAFLQALEQRSAGDAPVPRHYYYGPDGGDDAGEHRDETQARLYFLPHLAELLFADSDERAAHLPEAIQEWRLPAARVRNWRLLAATGHGTGDDDATVAELVSVRLLRYFNGACLLALRLRLSPQEVGRAGVDSDDADWWYDAAFGSGSDPADSATAVQRCGFERWLGFTRMARILYPSFAEQIDEHKIARLSLRLDGGRSVDFQPQQTLGHGARLPNCPGSGLSPIIAHLLGEFFGPNPGGRPLDGFLQRRADIHDDRLFVNVAYGLAGPMPTPPVDTRPPSRIHKADPEPAHGPLRRLFALALFVDRFADRQPGCAGYAYDPEWTRRELQTASLGLWDATGSFAGCTDSANVYLGCNGFFADIIGPRHVPYQYERMLVQALFYQASLRRFNRDISMATQRLIDDEHRQRLGGAAFRRERREFIDFTNRYWFHDLSAQLQGRHLFALQQQALGLEQEYQEIKNEMERADEYAESSRNTRLTRLSYVLGFVGLWVALVAIWVSVLPLVPMDGNIGQLSLQLPDGTVLGRMGRLLLVAVGVPLVVLLLGFGVWQGLLRLWRAWLRDRSRKAWRWLRTRVGIA